MPALAVISHNDHKKASKRMSCYASYGKQKHDFNGRTTTVLSRIALARTQGEWGLVEGKLGLRKKEQVESDWTGACNESKRIRTNNERCGVATGCLRHRPGCRASLARLNRDCKQKAWIIENWQQQEQQRYYVNANRVWYYCWAVNNAHRK